MKMKRVCGLVLVVCLISALVMAEASNEKEAGQTRKGPGVSAPGQRQAGGVPRVSPGRRGTPGNREQAYKEMLGKRMASHKNAITELEAIKKIAAEENAPRTVEAIGKMIDKKTAEFKQSMERFESQRRERSKRMQQRTAEKPARKKPAEKTEQKDAEQK